MRMMMRTILAITDTMTLVGVVEFEAIMVVDKLAFSSLFWT